MNRREYQRLLAPMRKELVGMARWQRVFETMLTDDGIHLFKYWLATDQAQQEERLRERMREATHTEWAPWTLVAFNDQKRGRLTLIRDLLDRLPDLAVAPPQLDLPPLGRTPLKERYGAFKPLLGFTG